MGTPFLHWFYLVVRRFATGHHPPVLRTTEFATALLGISLIAGIIVVPTTKMLPVSHQLKAQRIRFVNSSGASLPTFFADLPSHPKRWQTFLHRTGGTCQQTSVLSKLMNGFSGTVYAQTPCRGGTCSNCPGAIVQEIYCFECDNTDSYGTEWFGDFVPSGWRFTGSTECSGNCCYAEECSCF